jgi:hypothetical protein
VLLFKDEYIYKYIAMEYIYLIKEREFIKTEEEIYKIGRSSQYNAKRINQYPNGSIILLIIFCGNSEEIEKFLIIEFKKLFKQRRDIGLEYFEGCFLKMRDVITENVKKLDNITIDKFKKETQYELNKRIENIESLISERKKRNSELEQLKKKLIEKEKLKKEKEEELLLKKEEKKKEKEEELLLKKKEKIIKKEKEHLLKIENDKNDVNIIKDFLNYFELSDNINDYVLSREIQDWINEKKIGITMKKFGIEMKKYIISNNLKNVRNDVKKVCGISKNVWVGIKYVSNN